jgi:hypothetical protein
VDDYYVELGRNIRVLTLNIYSKCGKRFSFINPSFYCCGCEQERLLLSEFHKFYGILYEFIFEEVQKKILKIRSAD